MELRESILTAKGAATGTEHFAHRLKLAIGPVRAGPFFVRDRQGSFELLFRDFRKPLPSLCWQARRSASVLWAWRR
jgi:hypothetical protein